MKIEEFRKEIMSHMEAIIEIDLADGIDDYDLEERTIECYCNELLGCTRNEIEFFIGYDILKLSNDDMQNEFGCQEDKVLIKLSEERVYELLKYFFKQILIYDCHLYFEKTWPDYDDTNEYFKKNFKIPKKEYEKFFNMKINNMSDYR